jgi:mono/diheme cytochrome c family protein
MRRTTKIAGVVVLLLVLTLVVVLMTGPEDRTAGEAPPPSTSLGATSVERGRALVTLGDCRPCHTAQGGEEFAGGRAIPTPFGTFYSPNITPDAATGIGAWTAEDFWHALHNGYSRDGRPLYPTFPYTNYTKISRRDAQDMYEYLRTLPPVRRAARPHELQFPYSNSLALRLWRRAYFRPGVYEPDPARSAEWNRGAYLVEGLAHCSACHEARNSFGGAQSERNPAGGLVLNWYAPSLTQPQEAGLQRWPQGAIAAFLGGGRTIGEAGSSTPSAAAMGPMAEVIYESLQRVPVHELSAMAEYLKSLPESAEPPAAPPLDTQADLAATLENGRKTYAKHCARCHGDNGEGRIPAALPLAGNRAVTMASATNAVRILLYGGFTPGTASNPRPFGMPPFADTLSNTEIAEVLTYVRSAWSNHAPRVSPSEVARNRTGPQW